MARRIVICSGLGCSSGSMEKECARTGGGASLLAGSDSGALGTAPEMSATPRPRLLGLDRCRTASVPSLLHSAFFILLPCPPHSALCPAPHIPRSAFKRRQTSPLGFRDPNSRHWAMPSEIKSKFSLTCLASRNRRGAGRTSTSQLQSQGVPEDRFPHKQANAGNTYH
jgi:hypothetical protein